MQLTNAPDPAKFPAIEAAIEGRRLDRYMAAAKGDRKLAWRLYVWNGDLCEAFYLPLQTVEIVVRNAIHRALVQRCGAAWWTNPTFRNLLPQRCDSELQRAVQQEHQQHAGGMTDHHLVSALTFGFWETLTIKRFERLLWPRGVQPQFPHSAGASRQTLHDEIEKQRRWRNRIAHHRAIYDQSPTAHFQGAIQLIGWVSPDTAAWVTSEARVSQVVSARPS
jgi:hypothetical protein